jgi:hypothetical protein
MPCFGALLPGNGHNGAMTWKVPMPAPVDGPTDGDERTMLSAYLWFQRTNILRISAGLTAQQLESRPLGDDTLSLLGLIRHLAKVERIWFRERVSGESVASLHGGAGSPVDFRDGRVGDAPLEVAALIQEWTLADAAVALLPLEHSFEVGEESWSLRMVYLHMIGEYARHSGHADLLREQIDGVTGR